MAHPPSRAHRHRYLTPASRRNSLAAAPSPERGRSLAPLRSLHSGLSLAHSARCGVRASAHPALAAARSMLEDHRTAQEVAAGTTGNIGTIGTTPNQTRIG